MKVFVTGVNGQLGSDVMGELVRRGQTGIGSGRAPQCSGDAVCGQPYFSMDITDVAAVRDVLHIVRPDAVIHCAAWTAVDAAEKHENAKEVFAVNSAGTRNIAMICREVGCKLLYVSTDYVFDGSGETPWQPDSTDCHPLNIYGRSKLEGEQAVAELLERYFVVRTSWVFGAHGSNFVRTMLRLGQTKPMLRVVNDQIGRPTYTRDLARLLVDMIESENYGYYHASNEGSYISWYSFACEIIRQAGLATTVIPVSTAEYGTNGAIRPANSRLDTSKIHELGFIPLPDWHDALADFLKRYRES